MVEEYQLRLLPEEAYSEDTIRQYLSQEKGFDVAAIRAVRVVKRSIDARHRRVLVNLKVRAYINELPAEEPFTPTDYPDVSDQPSAIVVGAGPGGLFAALRLIEMGVRPIVLERGKSVEKRKRDLAAIPHTQTIDPESNYCLERVGQARSPTANSTRGRRSAAAWRRFSTSSASMVLRLPSWPMPIPISAQTVCRSSSPTCASASSAVAARSIFRPA